MITQTHGIEITDHDGDKLSAKKLASGSVIFTKDGKDIIILNTEDRDALIEFMQS